MGKLVKQKHLNLYKRYTEDLIEDLSSPVTLHYDEEVSQCPNCVYDAVHKCSSGKYNGSGPKPFTRGICPVCDGEGEIKTESSRTLNCTVNWVNLNEAKSDDFKIVPAGTVEVGFFKIKTLVSNYEALKTANYFTVDGVRARLMNVIKRGLKENVTAVAYLKRDD